MSVGCLVCGYMCDVPEGMLETLYFLLFVLFTEKNNDGSYLGKILEGFTLSQNPAEEKKVSIFRLASV